MNQTSWGGFGRLQLGVFDQLFMTMGLRAERNPNYGEAHKTDWTPNTGVSYTAQIRQLTAKVLGSYGRATKAPNPDYRLEELRNDRGYEPSRYIYRFGNPFLTPEYSRGPQVGLELYYGNTATLSVNYYKQVVSDLILQVVADSFQRTNLSTGWVDWKAQYQYLNGLKVKQVGLEGVGSLNIWRFNIKGTWAWTDSRTAISPCLSTEETFPAVPTHTGNIVASYALGGTSVTLSTNFMGRKQTFGSSGPHGLERQSWTASRIRTYVSRTASGAPSRVIQPGYSKADLTISQRVLPWISLIFVSRNITNSYDMDENQGWPTLGRQTTFGMSLRK